MITIKSCLSITSAATYDVLDVFDAIYYKNLETGGLINVSDANSAIKPPVWRRVVLNAGQFISWDGRRDDTMARNVTHSVYKNNGATVWMRIFRKKAQSSF